MKSTKTYIIKRIIQIPITLLIISVIVFGLIHVTPGDPVELALPASAPPELAQKLRLQLGLDKPLHVQYFIWIKNTLILDLGKSVHTTEHVTKMIGDRVLVTFTLATTAVIISIILSLFGVFAAVNYHKTTDYVLMLLTTIGISFPVFFSAIILILIFSVILDILPISGFINPFTDPIGGFRHILLPAFSLAIIYAALQARMIRNSMLDVLGQDYIRTARAKGLSENIVIFTHALKNALLPIITVVAMNYAYMLGGSIIIEQVFALPGMGRLLIHAVNTRDYPVIQGILLVVSLSFVVINLIADVLYCYIDPRIRL